MISPMIRHDSGQKYAAPAVLHHIYAYLLRVPNIVRLGEKCKEPKSERRKVGGTRKASVRPALRDDVLRGRPRRVTGGVECR